MKIRLTVVTAVLVGVAAFSARVRAEVPIVRLWPGDPPATQMYDGVDTIELRKSDPRPARLIGVHFPSLAVYLPAPVATPTAAIIICPGGGYRFEAVTDEGTMVAERLAAQGIAAFVLRYRLPDGHPPAADDLPVPQQDVFRAIQTVRSRAAEWHLNPKQIGVMGFSAGGHLAATAATLYDQVHRSKLRDEIDNASPRPDFAVLIYPVITMEKTATHGGSRKNLIGNDPDPALVDRFSAEKHVTPQTPPLYVVVAEDDRTVPPVNSHRMADAAEKAGVPHVLLDFKTGDHGFGLGRPGTESATWFDACLAWLREQKSIDAAPR